MKNIILSVLIIVLGLLFASCESDISEPKMSATPTTPTAANAVLPDSINMNYADSLLTFSWSAADFGFNSSTTYVVQLSDSANFPKVASLFTTQRLSGTAKVSDVNAIILAWGYPFGTSITVYYRVTASVSANAATAYSAVKTMSFKPYDVLINYPMVYVPGSYQGWSPGAANGRLYSYGFNSVYSSILRLYDSTTTTAQWKIATQPNWSVNYGGTLTANVDSTSYTCASMVSGGANFVVKNACYVVTFNSTALSITATKTNDWGIIGSAVPPYDWSKDVNMYYDGQRKMWEITANFNAGEFKFRADDGWSLNYGGSNGTLSAGGSNIALATAGNYTIRFDPVKLTYTVKKN